MKNHNTHIAAPPGQLYWRKSVPNSRSAKMLLRTVGGPAVIGNWYGTLGQYFTAWCPLPSESSHGKKNNNPTVLTPAPVDRMAQLEREVAHWKANHADIVNRAALLSQRPDLPVDRIPAYREMGRLQRMVDAYEKAYASAVNTALTNKKNP